MRRQTWLAGLLLLTVIGVALAQQSGPIGELRGTVNSDGSLAVVLTETFPTIIRKEWTFTDADGAQTDAALDTVAAGMKIVVTRASSACDADNTTDVGLRVGLATATLSARATSGVGQIVLSHPGIAAGSGQGEGAGVGEIVEGASDEDLRITMDDPAGGSCSVMISYYKTAS